MMRADEELEEFFRDFFATEVTPEVVDTIERAGTWPAALWEKMERIELPWIGLPESVGGVGGSLADVGALVRAAAFHAAPISLVEHHLAAHLLDSAGLERVAGALTVAGLGADDVPGVSGGRMTGRVASVPWGDSAAAVVVLTADDHGRDVVAVVEPGVATVEPGRDLAGVPCPSIVLDDATVAVGVVSDLAAIRRRAEVLRGAVMVGLLQRMYEITSRYVGERRQFGKPIGAFQAVQIHLVTLAQAVATASVSVDRAIAAVADGCGEFEVAATSLVVDDCARDAVAAAHQAHGAIGMTREYPLQQVSRRVHAWRQLWTPTSVVAARLGAAAHAGPSYSAFVARHPEEGRTTA